MILDYYLLALSLLLLGTLVAKGRLWLDKTPLVALSGGVVSAACSAISLGIRAAKGVPVWPESQLVVSSITVGNLSACAAILGLLLARRLRSQRDPAV